MKLLYFFILLSSYSYAAQWATVSADKAVIYSDQQMTSAIGFIKRGKKVRVGEVARNKGSLLPIIVDKKIAYIRIIDLKSAKEEKLVTSATARRKDIQQNKKSQSRLGLSYSRFMLQMENIEDSASTDNYAFNGGALKGYLNKKKSRVSYAAEIEYALASDENDKNVFEMYSFNFDVMYRIINFDNLSFSVLLGGVLVPLSQYTYDDLFTQNSSGLGGVAGAEVFLGLKEGLGIHANLKYKYIEMFGYDVPKNEDLGLASTYDPTFSGVSFQASLTYAF
jgi:hypothetical protein